MSDPTTEALLTLEALLKATQALKSTPTETDKALAEINATLKRIAQTLEKHEEI